MSKSIDAVRDFEGRYYADMPSEVRDSKRLRDEGWDVFRAGDQSEGLGMIQDSVGLGVDATSTYRRELYANTARYAQALVARGDFQKGVSVAFEAIDLIPRHLAVRGDGDSRERFPDQYEVIFSGRLSLIVGTSVVDEDKRSAVTLADRARYLARISENPERVAFIDDKMNDEERDKTRSKFGGIAWAATAGIYLPLSVPRSVAGISPIPLSRRDLAQRVCAK